MDLTLTISLILGYFALLFVISWLTGRKATEQTFFSADRSSPWYLVAFGMIGASLSGVTFLSVPGAVGGGQWAYLQIVMGNVLGYVAIAYILMPLYYRLNLTSIYGYLEQRYGDRSYKTGSILFLVSRVIGASLRLYLVSLVLQLVVCDPLGIPFEATVLISIALIYLYTFRGGIKTVVWTDTLQTFCMLLGAGIAVYVISSKLELDAGGLIQTLSESEYTQAFFWDWGPTNNFFKMLSTGFFISIVMTGLDQDMMQKNLTCRTLKDAQKNILVFSGVFFLANILFLSLGALLYIYGTETGVLHALTDNCTLELLNPQTGEWVCYSKTDQLFPLLARDYLGTFAGIVFILAVIAAAYSSADSALTALTTSFCVDLLGFEKRDDEDRKQQLRRLIHLGFAFVLFLVILVFAWINDEAVIWFIFRMAGYTYGPLLGLYAFGLYSKVDVPDQAIPWICLGSPLLTYLIQLISPSLLGYTFGFELLILNGALTMLGLWIAGKMK
ncbi:MAG: sodium:solute symporter [Bacteroidota bacterium]